MSKYKKCYETVHKYYHGFAAQEWKFKKIYNCT